MANTYTQIHIQAIFAVRRRVNLIQAEWEDDLYKYITGIVQANKHKLLAINGMPDHVHLCFGMRPDQSLSDLMQDIKGGSSKWVNEHKFLKSHFEWQSGYGLDGKACRAGTSVEDNKHNAESRRDETFFSWPVPGLRETVSIR